MVEKKYICNIPELMDEWDFEENKNLDPNKLLIGSNKTAAWICNLCGHKWKTSIYHRAIKGSCCRKCSSRRRKDFDINKSIFKTHPEISKDWALDKNGKLSPEMFPKGSRYLVNWKCSSCGSEVKKSIKDYQGCKECKNAKRIKKRNLETHFPNIAKEWHLDKNGNKLPSDFSPHSSKYAWWRCNVCDHSWRAKIANRTSLGRGCPVCANKVVIEGKNDLETTHPYLAQEWHPTKNVNINPKEVTYGSGLKVWWICPKQHEYKASILHRSHGTECPKCNRGRQTSFAEQATYFYIKELYPDAINRFTADFLERMELDIYIPSIKLAIEYDGEAWHNKNTIKREQRKYQLCKENGIKLIRLREKMPKIASDIADEMFSTDKLYLPKNLEMMLHEVLRRINFSETWMLDSSVDIDITRDRPKILEYKTDLKINSLEYLYPEIAKEWHKTKNGKQLPEHFQPGTDHKAWWQCPDCGNTYKAAIGKRTAKNGATGCPKCGIEKSTQAKRKAVDMIDPTSGKVLQTFISISDASRKMKINSSNITMVCKGQRPKAGGYRWAYSNKRVKEN
ncbi:zinc-ribbon domain-containing protein [Halobacteriovorax sp. YZS-1-1]|uniref:zinc-ribbon domain-containing protein n=1 Tax=unclassified Halobacteriovorax TaxID=2639665 RepID=UPI0039997991